MIIKNIYEINGKIYKFNNLKELPKNYIDLGYRPLIINKPYCKTIYAYYNNNSTMMIRVISHYGLDIMTIYTKNYFTNLKAVCYEINLVKNRIKIKNGLKYVDNNYIITKDVEKLFKDVIKQLYKHKDIYENEINCLKQFL